MNIKIETLITRIWYDPKYLLLAYLLWPLSLIYAGIIYLRRWCYQLRLFKHTKFNIPVIVVGNITAGGTGKTPLCIALCRFLQQQGLKPGIVTRGYGVDLQGRAMVVMPDQSAIVTCPDEALMSARQTGCPVAVAKKRVDAVAALLAQTDVNIIISDDGLQHFALARDLEIVMVDGQRKFGNGFLLPAGPLREPMSRLGSVDCIVYHYEEEIDSPQSDISSANAISLKPQALINVLDPTLYLPVTTFAQQPVIAMAGIGHPDRFFRTLQRCGYTHMQTIIFPDHHPFLASDFSAFNDATIIMTEKDAVKCQHIAPKNCWYLAVSVDIPAIVKARLVSNPWYRSVSS
jgi:tetraacyldisaccharide 4'-kinase